VTPGRLGVVALLGLALLLRLWGIRHGLPFAYSSDEATHFVPRAVRFFEGDHNPHYFKNPPGFAYVVHAVLAVWFVGRDAVADFSRNPSEVFTVARVVSALLGTATVGLLYLLGARLFDRRVGLAAGAVMAVAFLPVFYSHLALNDVPATVPLALSLFGSAGVLLQGRMRDYALAGAALGVGAATKYTAGIALFPLLAAAAFQLAPAATRRRALSGLALAGIAAAVAFFAFNPYSLLDFETFRDQVLNQSRINRHKLGMTHESGVGFYLWTLTWGLGWAPAVAALAGAVLLLREKLRTAALLLPALPLFLVAMVGQERFFGRWLLPAFPFVCLLAGYAVVRIGEVAHRFRPRLGPAVATVALAGVLAQGLLYSVHVDLVLSRADTRALARAWMLDHVPQGREIVLEPVVPASWASPWRLNRRNTALENYPRRLKPSLIETYREDGACWVVSGSTISGRAFAEPEEVPAAIAYYRELRRRAAVVYHVRPYDTTVPFDFDWSFDYYPLAYERPGPELTIYKLRGPGCA
jgi:4-amino-4-deoxy-L-arabinose transferase-like glycosyltransferase